MAVETPAGLQFDQIIHINCSKWESRRAMQRTMAEELKVPAEVIEILDRQDEEDDYNGVPKGSRTEIEQVLRAMHLHIQKLNQRQLVIFQNGSNEEMDLTAFGFPLYGYSRTKVLWTFQGRFRLKPRTEVDMAIVNSTTTHVFLSASHDVRDPVDLWSFLIYKETTEVASMVNIPGVLGPATDCFFYMLKICCMGSHHLIDYDFATHGSNYWVCDGIMKLQQQGEKHVPHDDETWRAADALQYEMRLAVDYCRFDYQCSPLVWCTESMPYWYSPPYLLVPAGAIPNGDIFQHFKKLGVLKLSRCTFSFSSPPFLFCNNLRFLWLDHCENQDQSRTTNEVVNKEIHCRFFQRLWVLDVRYTCCDRILSTETMDHMSQLRELNVMGVQDWDLGQLLMARLPDIHKLRVTKSTINCSSSSSTYWSQNEDLILGMMKTMELFEFSGNRFIVSSGLNKKSLVMAANDNLLLVETVIIDDGCVGLEKVSFRGCAKLKNALLKGLFQELKSIDLSGTAMKTLDLSAMIALNLDEILALGCEKLCAILWPDKEKINEHLSKLRIGTITTENIATPSSLSEKYGSRAPTDYDWYVSVKDARFLRSLVPFEKYFNEDLLVHMEISSAAPDLADSKEESSWIVMRDQVITSVNLPLEINYMQQTSQGNSADESAIQLWPTTTAII